MPGTTTPVCISLQLPPTNKLANVLAHTIFLTGPIFQGPGLLGPGVPGDKPSLSFQSLIESPAGRAPPNTAELPTSSRTTPFFSTALISSGWPPGSLCDCGFDPVISHCVAASLTAVLPRSTATIRAIAVAIHDGNRDRLPVLRPRRGNIQVRRWLCQRNRNRPELMPIQRQHLAAALHHRAVRLVLIAPSTFTVCAKHASSTMSLFR